MNQNQNTAIQTNTAVNSNINTNSGNNNYNYNYYGDDWESDGKGGYRKKQGYSGDYIRLGDKSNLKRLDVHQRTYRDGRTRVRGRFDATY